MMWDSHTYDLNFNSDSSQKNFNQDLILKDRDISYQWQDITENPFIKVTGCLHVCSKGSRWIRYYYE